MYVDRRTRLRRKKQRKKIFLFSILFLSFLAAIVSGLKIVKNSQASDIIISPIPQNSKVPLKIVKNENEVVKVLAGNELSKKIEVVLQNEEGDYGILFKNLKTGEIYTRNEHMEFETASLYKLFVMGKTYQEIANGSLALNSKVSDTVERLNQRFDIDPEYAELTEGSFSMTVEEALEKMITISHNYSALLLSSKLGISKVQIFMDNLGLTSSKLGNPPISIPQDIALFFEKLYKKEIVSEDASNDMLDLLSRQQINDRIPAGVDEGIRVAHKTGELGSYKHDAGIVFTPYGDYILVLMSRTPSQIHAIEVEAKISRVVYEYLQKDQ